MQLCSQVAVVNHLFTSCFLCPGGAGSVLVSCCLNSLGYAKEWCSTAELLLHGFLFDSLVLTAGRDRTEAFKLFACFFMFSFSASNISTCQMPFSVTASKPRSAAPQTRFVIPIASWQILLQWYSPRSFSQKKKIAFCTQEKWLGSENSHTSNFCNAMWVLFSWNYGFFFMNMVCEMGLLLDNLCFSNGIQFVTEGFAYTSSLSVFLGNWSSTVIRTKIGKPLSVYCREIPTLMFKQVVYLNPQFAVLTKQFGR